jgi:hypothetical protein
VPKGSSDSAALKGSIVCGISDKSLRKLRIARAYIKLLCIPERSPGASVSLARMGNCEIRIIGGPEANPDGMPLFWLELFDHGAKTSIDSFGCHEIEDAVVIFEDFILQAVHLNEASVPDGSGTES